MSSISALLSVASLHYFPFNILFICIIYTYVAMIFTITLHVNIYIVPRY
jgi:hypothetical protein